MTGGVVERRLNQIPPVDMEHTAMIRRMDARSVVARQQQRGGLGALELPVGLGAVSVPISTISMAAMVDQSHKIRARTTEHAHSFNLSRNLARNVALAASLLTHLRNHRPHSENPKHNFSMSESFPLVLF